jgi:zinc transporter ZupT
MLRLVHPDDGRKPPSRRHRPSTALLLTPEETRHAKNALRATARAYGGVDVLATVIGVPAATIYQAASKRRRPSGILVIRLAAAAGMSVEAVLSGKLTEAGRCPACGSRVGDRPAHAAGGAS